MKNLTKRNCANCGKLFQPKDHRAIYCQSSCRVASCRKRKKAEAISPGNNQASPHPPLTESKTTIIEVRNPKYTELEAAIANAKSNVVRLRKEEKRLLEEKESMVNENTLTDTERYLKPVLIWGGSTSLVGFLVLKSQSKRSSDDNSGKANLINLSIVIFLVVVVSAIGIWVTDDKRKKKGFEYPKILKRLEEIPTSIDKEERLIKKLEAELLLVPVLLQKEKVEHVQPKTDIPLTDEKLVGPEFNEPAEINEIEA